MLVSQDLLNDVGYFEVNEFTSLSNHCALSCTLLTNVYTQRVNQCQLDPLPKKFIWSHDAIDLYINNINNTESKNKLNNFLQNDFTDIDNAVASFSTILYDNAIKSAKLVSNKPVSNSNTKRQIKKPWFSSSCRELCSSVKNYEKLINKCPHNADYRQKLYSLRSKLRRLCKHEEKKYKQRICTELNNTSEGNPKQFWKLLNKLNHQSRGNNHSDDN